MRRGGASPPQPAQPRPLWRSSLTQPHSMLSFPPHAPCRSSSCWAVVWGRCVSMTRKPRRISVKSISTTTCPGELEPIPHHQGRRLPSVVRGARPFSSPVPHLLCRIQPQDQSAPSLCGQVEGLTQAHVCCRILSLACSPNGASFVCSAAAPSLTSQVDFSAPDIGSKGMNQVPGRLLLWDTKTMKQQVRACPVALSGARHTLCIPLGF